MLNQFPALFYRYCLILIVFTLTPVAAYAVDAPKDLRGTVVRSAEIKWEWSRVSDAVRYQVNVNGSFVAMTNNTYFYSRELAPGEYSFTLQSVDSNGQYSSPSDSSASRQIGGNNTPSEQSTNSNTSNNNTSSSVGSSNLPAPRDPRGTLVRNGEIKWEWSSVSGAEQYEVFINNNPIGLTRDRYIRSHNLSEGEYAMKVRAIDYNGNRSVDSHTARRTVSSGQGSTSSAAVNSVVNNNRSTVNADTTSNNTGNASIAAPRDPRGTRVRPAEIKWEWASVSGANEYEVSVNGQVTKTANTHLYSKNLSAGEHTMTVKAINSDGQFSNSSNQAKASTSVNGSGESSNSSGSQQSNNPPAAAQNDQNASVSVPRDVRGTQVRDQEVKWEWSNVQGAARYDVYLDGALAGSTNNDYLYTKNLSGGEHKVAVAAVDSEGRTSNRSNEVSVNVSGGSAQASNTNNTNNTNNNVAPPPPENDNGLIDPASYNYSEVNQKNGYQLVFSDEFNGNSINRARWNTQLRWDGSHNGDRYEYRLVNGEAQFYVNIFSEDQEHLNKVASVFNPFEFNGNRLAIRTKRNPLKTTDGNKGYGPLSTISTQQPFLSGAITTYDKFTQKYGYFEARIKIPDHVGTFPAFWLHHQKREWEGTQKTEIDIMENLGHAPWYVYNSFHYFTGVSEGVSGKAHHVKPKPEGQIHTGTIWSDDYRVYAAEWTPGHIRFMIDGEQVSEVQNSASNHEELYIIINMAIGGNWANMATNSGGMGRDSNNRFPTQQDINEWQNPALEIDYVRVYKAN